MFEGPMIYTLIYAKGDGESEMIHTHNRREAVRVYKELSPHIKCALIDNVLDYVIATNVASTQLI